MEIDIILIVHLISIISHRLSKVEFIEKSSCPILTESCSMQVDDIIENLINSNRKIFLSNCNKRE